MKENYIPRVCKARPDWSLSRNTYSIFTFTKKFSETSDQHTGMENRARTSNRRWLEAGGHTREEVTQQYDNWVDDPEDPYLGYVSFS